MAKNLIPEIAQMLGVKLNEEFKIKGEDELMTYSFNSDGLQVTYGDGIELPYISNNLVLVALVSGRLEIIKLPWKPKFGDRYFGVFEFNGKLQICRYDIWRGTIAEEAQYRCGWVYRTREEAEAALPKVAAEIGVQYVL